MRQQVSFEFTMDAIRTKWGDVAGMDLVVTARIFDWYFRVTRTETSYTKVLRDNYILKLIGKKHRAFKPLAPFKVHVSCDKFYVICFKLKVHVYCCKLYVRGYKFH